MPKTIIREYDNTKPGNSLYANFSVVVPGLVNEDNKDAFAAVADENGVYEVSSQKDFEANVGLVDVKKAILVSEAVPAEIDGDIVTFAPVEAQEATEDDPSTPEDESSPAVEGKTIKEVFNEYCERLEDDVELYLVADNPDPEDIGYLKNDLYIFTRVKGSQGYVWRDAEGGWPESKCWNEQTRFAVIKDSKKGADAARGEQYGNLIAYELLGLGYTVLYKAFDSEKIEDLEDYYKFWECLTDRSLYDFRYIISGFLSNVKEVSNCMIKLAHFYNELPAENGRGDCIALIDVDKEAYETKAQSEAIKNIQKWLGNCTASKYAAYFAPYVEYDLPVKNGVYKGCYTEQVFPAAFHYLACGAKAAENYNEWYANAGYTRGVSKYTIKGVGCRFGEEAVNAFEPRYATWNAIQETGMRFALNVIKTVKGNYYLWGNRTAEALLSEEDGGDLMASHFLNIRELCTTIKKHTYRVCDSKTFDPNSDILWESFCAEVRPLLEKMKADQGITDYKFVKVKTSQKALMKAKIRIVPIEAVEDFDIGVYLENSVAGIVATVEEE